MEGRWLIDVLGKRIFYKTTKMIKEIKPLSKTKKT